jgi:eukaryotic-like serine/threonine-protein kinase
VRGTEAFYGRLANARKLSQRAIDSARANASKETAAAWQMNAALREAEFQNVSRSRQQIGPALAEAPTRDVTVLAALAYSRIGDIEAATRIAHDLVLHFPLNTAINRYWLPTNYASLEITRHDPAKALEDLQTTIPYELGSPLPQFEAGGSLYPVYVRGELLLHQGKEAAAEFQKFLDHPGVAVSCPLAALARLQLGRAYALQGDSVRSRAAYQDFFTVWKEADPDIGILIMAKSEYAKLK